VTISLVPATLRGYQRSWLARDVAAGVTLAAVAIPEVMGYTTIARTPVVTGLYTIIFPTALFALVGSSRLLVVGADSATAAILAAGLGSLSVAGLTPDSPQWVAWCSLTALVCAAMLLVARVLRLGFLGDFLSSSVLIGFLTGVGIQVLTGQIPSMLGVPKGSGNWFAQQLDWIKEIHDIQWATFAFALGTVVIIQGLKRFRPRVPGAVVAVILSIIISAATDARAHGVAVVGSVQGGFPPVGLPRGVAWSDVPQVIAIAFSCFVLIIAQSAATSRSFATKHGQRVDVNRDIVGLAGANAAAGLSGTFVVNGSPTKTQILDGQKGRTQLANLTMSLVVLIVTLFATGLLTDMPTSVLAAIVFLIGLELVDLAGMRAIATQRRSEFVIAAVTAVIVFAVGVEQGIVAAVVLSLLDLIRRQYQPRRFVIGLDERGRPTYVPAAPGAESRPGLIVFRYDAELFFANTNRFLDDAEALVEGAPTRVRLFVLDCSSLNDVDFSACRGLLQLIDYLHAHGARFGIAEADASVVAALGACGVMDRVAADHVFGTVADALDRPPAPEPVGPTTPGPTVHR